MDLKVGAVAAEEDTECHPLIEKSLIEKYFARLAATSQGICGVNKHVA